MPAGVIDTTDQLNRLVAVKAISIGAFEAKTHLSELLEQVRLGRTYRITRRGRPVAELRPLPVADRRPRFGCDKGRVTIRADFDDPIPGVEEYGG